MNYDKYTFRRREMISFLIAVTVLFLLIGKLFFGTFLAGGLCIVFFPFLWKKTNCTLLAIGKISYALHCWCFSEGGLFH